MEVDEFGAAVNSTEGGGIAAKLLLSQLRLESIAQQMMHAASACTVSRLRVSSSSLYNLRKVKSALDLGNDRWPVFQPGSILITCLSNYRTSGQGGKSGKVLQRGHHCPHRGVASILLALKASPDSFRPNRDQIMRIQHAQLFQQ